MNKEFAVTLCTEVSSENLSTDAARKKVFFSDMLP